MSQQNTIAFLPWVRRGASTQITRLEQGQPAEARASIAAKLTINQVEVSRDVFLLAPEDIAGLDPRVILRTFPEADALHAPANELAFVELSEVDLPWRFTPATNEAGTDRLTPWLRLVVLKENELQRFEPPGPERKVGILTPTSIEALPPPGEAWAWAHVQAIGLQEDSAAPALVNVAPERFLTRLLCPRRLKAHERYLACLVPVYERGRRSALGEALTGAGAFELAWQATGAPPVLPVYHSWRFRTGTAQDFATLARRLERFIPGPQVGGDLGTRGMDLSSPGLDLPPAQTPVALEGALMAPGAGGSWSDAAFQAKPARS